MSPDSRFGDFRHEVPDKSNIECIFVVNEAMNDYKIIYMPFRIRRPIYTRIISTVMDEPNFKARQFPYIPEHAYTIGKVIIDGKTCLQLYTSTVEGLRSLFSLDELHPEGL